MELHQVRYFLTLARTLNFTRAAEICNVTQPALTKAIQKLEQQLGGALLHRERQLTQLTELGKLVLPMVERTVEAADSVRVHAREFQSRGMAASKIGLTPCVSAALVVRPISEIASVIPGLQIELAEAPGPEIAELLLEGAVNAAITGDYDELPDRIDHWDLFEESFVVLTAADSELARLETIPVASLADAVWLEPVGCGVGQRFWDRHLPGAPDSRIVHRGCQEGGLQHMAAAGLGIMLAPEHAPYLPSLVARPIEGYPLRRRVRLLAVAGRRYTPALHAFIKAARLRDWNSEISRRKSGELEGETELRAVPRHRIEERSGSKSTNSIERLRV